MSDFEAKFTFEENDPIKATFKAYDNPPEVVIETKSYDELADKPLINDVELVGNKTLDELGIQPQGNYALTSDIPDLTDYVKKTDYASDTKAGLLYSYKINSFGVDKGKPICQTKSLAQYQQFPYGDLFIGKGTLENIKDDYVKRGITENDIELSEEEKANAKNWLGYATPTEILQAIASIPQFRRSIVNELPMIGEKMVLYFVPKEGADNDIYNEYVWIEQTSSYEFLGSTAVDLTDYVKNTDYAGIGGKAGVIKVSATYGFAVAPSNGYLAGISRTLEQFETIQSNSVISKGTLVNVLTQYAKIVSITQADYDALETKDANTLYLIEEE